MAKNYFILLISFLGAVALADYAIVSGFINFNDTKIEKTESPDASVLYKLAQKYELGVEVEKDLDKAVYWYGVAADNGSTEARSRLDVLSVQVKNNKKTLPLESPPDFDTKYKEIDDEAEKITKILEKQLAREEEKARRTKQKKKEENERALQQKLAEEKAEADRIQQQNEKTATINRETMPANVDIESGPLATKLTPMPLKKNAQSTGAKVQESSIKPDLNSQSPDVIDGIMKPDSADVTQQTTINEQNISVNTPKPAVLQPARPLSLTNTKSNTTKSTTNSTTNTPPDYVSAYEESVDNEESKTESSNKTPPKTAETEEEKKFNVNPCNGPAARFMSTCR